jgi:hypothetical protein
VVVIDARRARPDLDEATLCPKTGPTGVAAIVIDATDSVGVIQREDISNRLRGLRLDLPAHWLFSIFSLAERVDAVPQSAIRLCNPGRGENLSQITSNPALVEKRWRERFEGPISHIVDNLTQIAPANASPLMEMTQAVAVTELTKPEVEKLPKRLILVSDMLQHSDHFSMYGSAGPDFAAFKKSPAFAAVRADLRGVDVEIYLISRPSELGRQNRALVDFWGQYFESQGAKLVHVLRITGE